METFGPEETATRLPYAELAESIREVARARQEEGMWAPSRTAVPLPEGGVFLVMPASDRELSITKLVTVHPRNTGRSLPTIQGEVVVMEAPTGVRLGLLDGSVVTGRRTAALSLLAAKKLAPHPEGPLLIVGAGDQARAHLEAFREGLGVSRVFISSRTRERANTLAEYATSLGMDARVAERPEQALEEARLVVTATTSRKPVLPDEVPEDTFIAAVGSFQPEAAELSSALVSISSVIVDTLEGAREEAGDLIQAEKTGAFEWERAVPLERALSGFSQPDGPIVFKSVGDALWDLAAARVAFGSRGESNEEQSSLPGPKIL